MKFTKEDARRRVLNCAKQYQQKLLNWGTYSVVKHVAKGLNLNHIILPDEINDRINLENYLYNGTKNNVEFRGSGI